MIFKKIIIYSILITFLILLYKKLFTNCEKFSVPTCSQIKEENNNCNLENEENLYNELMGKNFENWKKIFEAANGNRNAGGVQFFDHIMTKLNPMELTKSKFESFNKFYCGVSGSVVKPCSKPDFVKIKKTGSDSYVYGYYYRCCWPCVCDIIKYAETEEMEIELKDGVHKFYVLTIDDPCKNEEKIPNEVSSFICQNNKTVNGQFSPSGRLIFALLHKGREYSNNNFDPDSCLIDCTERNNTNPDDLVGGMGDIFVKLSLVNKNL